MGGRTRRRTCVHERARMRARALHTLGRAARRGRTVRVGTHVFWHTCPLARLHACTRAHLRTVHVYSLYACSLAHLHSCTLAHVCTCTLMHTYTHACKCASVRVCKHTRVQGVRGRIHQSFYTVRAVCAAQRRGGALHGCNLPFVVRGCDTRVTSPPFASPRVTSPPFASPRVTSPPLTSPRLNACHIPSPRLAACHILSLASPRVIPPRRVSRPPQVRVRGAINDPTVKDEGWSVVCR
jgi:hypothetical protein